MRNEQLALRIVRWLVQVAAERRIEVCPYGQRQRLGARHGHRRAPTATRAARERRRSAAHHGRGCDEPPPRAADATDGRGDRGPHPGRARRAAEDRQPPPRDERRAASRVADRRRQRPGDRRCPSSFAAELRTERRAVDLPAGHVVQLAQLAPAGQPEGVIAARSPRPGTADAATAATLRRRHVAVVVGPRGRRPPTPPAHFVAPLPVAIDTESGEWVWVDGVDDGPVFAVAGQPKSGRSSTLAALARLAHEQGWAVLNVLSSRRSPLAASDAPALAVRVTPEALGGRDRGHRWSSAGGDRRPPALGGLDGGRGGVEAPRPCVVRGVGTGRLPVVAHGCDAQPPPRSRPASCWRPPARSTARRSGCGGYRPSGRRTRVRAAGSWGSPAIRPRSRSR